MMSSFADVISIPSLQGREQYVHRCVGEFLEAAVRAEFDKEVEEAARLALEPGGDDHLPSVFDALSRSLRAPA